MQLYATFNGSHTPRVASDITMDNAMFAKLVKECRLLGKVLTAGDADVVFSKSKAIGQV